MVVLTTQKMSVSLLAISRAYKYSLGNKLNITHASKVFVHQIVVGMYMALLRIKLDAA